MRMLMFPCSPWNTASKTGSMTKKDGTLWIVLNCSMLRSRSGVTQASCQKGEKPGICTILRAFLRQDRRPAVAEIARGRTAEHRLQLGPDPEIFDIKAAEMALIGIGETRALDGIDIAGH